MAPRTDGDQFEDTQRLYKRRIKQTEKLKSVGVFHRKDREETCINPCVDAKVGKVEEC